MNYQTLSFIISSPQALLSNIGHRGQGLEAIIKDLETIDFLLHLMLQKGTPMKPSVSMKSLIGLMGQHIVSIYPVPNMNPSLYTQTHALSFTTT